MESKFKKLLQLQGSPTRSPASPGWCGVSKPIKPKKLRMNYPSYVAVIETTLVPQPATWKLKWAHNAGTQCVANNNNKWKRKKETEREKVLWSHWVLGIKKELHLVVRGLVLAVMRNLFKQAKKAERQREVYMKRCPINEPRMKKESSEANIFMIR